VVQWSHKSSGELPQMTEKLSTISVAQQLLQSDLFYFTAPLLADLLGLGPRQTYHLIARLRADGLVDQVENGKYLLLGLEPEKALSNPLYIASHLVAPGYVSYWSALHHYGFTEQVPLTTFVATTKRKRPIAYRDFRFHFVSVKPHKFFGYRRERLGDLPTLVADEAKAIVDSLDLPQHAGGMGEVARGLRAALGTVDVDTLVEYANRMDNKSLCSRLGYLLDVFGHPADGLVSSAGPVKLDPRRPRAGPTVARWRVIVNLPEQELAGREGVG
jgi:predicted transcriptional regulator of viral defense system